MKKYISVIFALLTLCACTPQTQSTPLRETDYLDYPDKQLQYRGHIYYMWEGFMILRLSTPPIVHAIKNNTTMTNANYIRLQAQLAVLKDVAVDYSGKTIDNIIQQLEARKEEVEHEMV